MSLSFPRRFSISSAFASFAAAAVLLVFVFHLTLPARAQSSSFQGRVIRVERGDEITVRLDAWDVTVRLHGIACPDHPEALAVRAREYTVRRVLNTPVKVTVRGTAAGQTVYGEVVPFRAKDSLNRELAGAGLAAWAHAYAPGRSDIAALERSARSGHRGMWGSAQGGDVPLPPQESALMPRPASPKPKATPKPTPRPTPRPTPVATPTPAPTQTATPVTTPTASPVTPSHLMSRALPKLPEPVASEETTAPTAAPEAVIKPSPAGELNARKRPQKHAAKRSPVAPVNPRNAAAMLTAAGSGLLAILSWGAGLRFWRREQILRSAVVGPAVESLSDDSFVRLTGRAEAVGTSPLSVVGRVAGIYVREITQRYEAPKAMQTGIPPPVARRKRSASSLRWVTISTETQAADFVLGGGGQAGAVSAAVMIEATRARFHPFRIARFYNDVPVEGWFARAYSGDTRTEVHFIPPLAEVTVWGRLYRAAIPAKPGASEMRIGYDYRTRCLEVTEGDGARLFSSVRPLVVLLLTLCGMGFSGLAAFALLHPEALPK